MIKRNKKILGSFSIILYLNMYVCVEKEQGNNISRNKSCKGGSMNKREVNVLHQEWEIYREMGIPVI